MVAGLLSAAIAAAGIFGAWTHGSGQVGDPGRLSTPPPRTITVRQAVYLPGETSGWHRHAGIHVVTVIAGTLTVYDSACQPSLYGPGDSYIGGREPHLARNEGGTETRMVVTYVPDLGSPEATVPAQAPDQCQMS